MLHKTIVDFLCHITKTEKGFIQKSPKELFNKLGLDYVHS